MRILLDTHVFLWAVTGSSLLRPTVRRLIEEADPDALAAAIEPSGFRELRVRASHAAGAQALASHHHDPFDRLLIAQALAELLRLVTADAMLARSSDIVLVV